MFFDKTVYPKLEILEKAYPQIRDEMLAVSHGIRMRTWPEAHKFDGSWKVFGLYHNRRKLENFCKLCPVTTATIESMGIVTMAGFSKMDAKTRILPHFDEIKEERRIHMGLKVPSRDITQCAFSVEGHVTTWEEGKAFVFDPRKLHEAWNRTDTDRVILLLDFEDFC